MKTHVANVTKRAETTRGCISAAPCRLCKKGFQCDIKINYGTKSNRKYSEKAA